MFRLQWATAPRPRFGWISQASTLPGLFADPPPEVAAVFGPTGPMGPKGDPGDGFDFVQASPSDEWVVNHNLGFRPSVTVLSPGGVEVAASVIHQSINQLRVYFAAPQSGAVHCV